MPLIIAAAFFALLFALEGLYFLTRREQETQALCRYEASEHKRKARSDLYLDML